MFKEVTATDTLTRQLERLETLLEVMSRPLVLTGAGISTGSGIPEYRDERGEWKRPPPVQFKDFVSTHATRQRYWARGMVGWPWFARARPNACHQALAGWEQAGRIDQLCLSCGHRESREAVHQRIGEANPDFVDLTAEIAPDGDAYLEGIGLEGFVVPDCDRCGGMLKPDVVFFGESIPGARARRAIDAMEQADGLLVIGSSLMVYSGFRFCRLAAERHKPIVLITPGRTRADDLATLKIDERFETVLDRLGDTAVPPT